MAKHSFVFRTYATDETANWNLPDALKGATAFGLYFFLEGERTHICSMTPSSRVEFLENYFLGADDEEAAEKVRENGELAYECDGQYTSYFGYIDATRPSPYIGPRQTFTLDSNDYELDAELYADLVAKGLRYGDSPQKAHADARYGCLRDFAYEVAREEFGMNHPSEPAVLWPAGFEAHKLRKAVREAERAGPPPLFATAGVDAPIAIGPR